MITDNDSGAANSVRQRVRARRCRPNLEETDAVMEDRDEDDADDDEEDHDATTERIRDTTAPLISTLTLRTLPEAFSEELLMKLIGIVATHCRSLLESTRELRSFDRQGYGVLCPATVEQTPGGDFIRFTGVAAALADRLAVRFPDQLFVPAICAEAVWLVVVPLGFFSNIHLNAFVQLYSSAGPAFSNVTMHICAEYERRYAAIGKVANQSSAFRQLVILHTCKYEQQGVH